MVEPLARVRWNSAGPDYDATYVSGYFPTGSAPAAVELLDAGLNQIDSALIAPLGGGWYRAWFAVPIRDGYTVRVSGGGLAQDVYVEPLDDHVDNVADAVNGTFAGLPHTPVEIEVDGQVYRRTTDGSGGFSVDLNGVYDFLVGDTALIHYLNASGDRVYYQPRVYGIRARWNGPTTGYNDDYVDGYLPDSTAPVDVSRAGVAATVSDSVLDADGRFEVSFGSPITDSNVITATDGATTRTLATPIISAQAHVMDDRVFGTAHAGDGAPLVGERLQVHMGSVEREAVVQADGTWSVSFAGQTDIGWGDDGWVRYTESDGDEAYYYVYAGSANYHLATLYLYDYLGGADVRAYFPIPNHPVSVTLWSGGGGYKGGTWYTTGFNGYYEVDFGTSVAAAGDVIRVVGDVTQTHVIPAVFNGVGDANSDSVTGQVSAAAGVTATSGTIYPNLYVYVGGQGEYATTDGAGNFVADFSAIDDLVRGDDGYVLFSDVDGNQFYRNVTVPGISYSGVGDTSVEGYFPESGVPVTATLYTITDAFKSRFTATAGGANNYFSDWFTDTVQMGDLISVTGGASLLALRVPTVMATSNAGTDLVYGTIESDASGVEVNNTDPGKYPLLYVYTNLEGGSTGDGGYVTSTVGGDFVFAASGDIWGGDWGYVEYTDPNGNWVAYWDGFRAHGIRVQEGSTYVIGEGFLPHSTVTATLSGYATSDTDVTDGQGYFTELFWFGGNNFDPGRTITVTDGVNTYTVTVPALDIRAYTGGDRIYGAGLDPTARLEVAVSEENVYREVTPLGGGDWELDLSQIYDFDYLYGGYIYYRYTEQDGDLVYHASTGHRIGANAGYAQVRWSGSGWDSDRLRGYFPGYTAGNITCTLHAADGAWRDQQVDTFINTGGYYDVSFNALPDEIQNGDFITVTDGASVIRIDVPTYTVDFLDYAVDRITGTIAYTDGVHPVQASGVVTSHLLRAVNTEYDNNFAHGAFFHSDANGAYDLDLSGTPRGIYANDYLRYLYVDGDGNEVYYTVEWLRTTDQITTGGDVRWYYHWGDSPVGPGPDGYYDGHYIRGYWTSSFPASFTIDWYDASAGLVRSESVSSWPDSDRRFYDDLQTDLSGGDVLTISDGVDTVVIPIADMQIETNVDADVITVTNLPAGKAAQVQLYNGGAWLITNTVADGAGQAVVDWSGTVDLLEGDTGYVVYDPHGFAVYTAFDVVAPAAPVVYTPPRVDVYEYYTTVMVDKGVDDDMWYTLTLRTGGAVKDVETGWTGVVTEAWLYLSETILPGDTVDVALRYPDDVERSASVYADPQVTVTGVDVGTNVVTATAPAGITGTSWLTFPHLFVEIGAGQFVTGATTLYVADALSDVVRNETGRLWYGNSDGHHVILPFGDPRYVLYENSPAADVDVEGWTLLPHTVVTVTVRDGDGHVRAWQRLRSNDGRWFEWDGFDPYGGDLKIRPGDAVTFDVAGEGATTIVAPRITALADLAADMVSGAITGTAVTLPIAGSIDDDAPSLRVWSNATALEQYVTATVGSGEFVADALGNLFSNHNGEIRYVRDDGHEVYTYWRVPFVRLRGSCAANFGASRFCVTDPLNGGGVTVTLTLLDSAGAVKESEVNWVNGTWDARFIDLYGNAVPIQNGDTVVMAAAGHVFTVPVPATFYAEASYVNNTVSGQITGTGVLNPLTTTTPVTSVLWLRGFGGPDQYLPTDGDGYFDVTLGDFDATATGNVIYIDAAGHQVFQRALSPWSMIHLGGNRVDGSVVRPSVPVLVTLRRGGADVDTEQAISDADGLFAVLFTDDLGNDVIIEGGDQVVIQASPPITVDVPTIEVYPDATTDVVTGTITLSVAQNLPTVPPNLSIKLDVGSGIYRWVTTTASAPYTFGYDFAGEYDLDGGDTGEVRYTNAAGHQVYVNFVTPEPPPPGPFTPELTLRDGGEARVAGRVVRGGQDVRLTLSRSGAVLATAEDTADAAGYFGPLDFADAALNPVPVLDGDRVEMTSLETSLVYTVPTMSGLGADPTTGEVSGTLSGPGVDHPIPVDVVVTPDYHWEWAAFDWTDISATGDDLGLDGDDTGVTITLGFDFPFYTGTYTQAYVNSNGLILFGGPNDTFVNQSIPTPGGNADNFVAPFWDDQSVYVADDEYVYSQTFGTAPDRYTVIQWMNRDLGSVPLDPVYQYQAILHEDGRIIFQYNDMTHWWDGDGSSATVGIEDEFGFNGVQYSYNASNVWNGLALAIISPTVEAFPVALTDTLYVEVNGAEYVTTTAGGDFSTLNGQYPLDVENTGFLGGDSGFVRYEDTLTSGERYRVYYNFLVPVHTDVPQLFLRWTWGTPETAEGWVAWPNEPVALTLRDAGSALKGRASATSDGSAYFQASFTDAAGNPTPVLDGDVVELTSLDTHVVFTVPLHTIALDHVSDRITGTLTGLLANHPITYAPAITQDELRINIDWTEHLSTTASGEFWTADQSFAPGDLGRLAFRDSATNGHDELAELRYVAYWFNAPYSDFTFDGLRVRGNGTHAVAEANYAGQSVTFRLYDGTDGLLEDRPAIGAPWGDGDYAVNFSHHILPGYRVEAVYDADPAVTRSFTVPDLAVTGVDVSAETVVGTASFTEPFEVNWNGAGMDWDAGALDNPGGTTRVVTPTTGAPTTGAWLADFLPDEDVGAGEMAGHLLYTDPDGDQLYQRYAAQQIVVYKDTEWVEGPVSNGGVTVTMTLLDAGGAVKEQETFQAGSDGDFDEGFYDLYDNPVYAHAGDQVVVQASPPVTIAVPELAAWADGEAETVVGQSSLPNQTLYVWVNGDDLGGGCGLTVLTGGSGDYTADFTGRCDLRPGDDGFVWYDDVSGNRVQLDFFVPGVHVRQNLFSGDYLDFALWGYTAAGTEVTTTVVLADAGGEVKSATANIFGPWSIYTVVLFDEYGNPTPIEAGDTLTLTETAGMGVRQQVFTVPPMTAETDVLADIVSGQATSSAGAPILVEVNGNDQTVTTTVGGAYTANFAPAYDVQNGDRVRLTYADAAHGRWFYFQNRAPVVLVRWDEDGGFYDDDKLSGYTEADAWVVLTLWRAGAPVGSASGTADGSGYYELIPQDDYGNPVPIQDGDLVQVQTVHGVTSVPVVPVTFEPDADAQTVTGDSSSLAGTEFEVCFGLTPTCRTALVDGAGHYTATFPAGTFGRGEYGWANQLNADQNQVYYRFYVPVSDRFVRVVAGGYTDDSGSGWNVGGMVPVGGAPVTVTLSAGGLAKSVTFAVSQLDGEFGATLENSYGDPILILPGDEVQVESVGMTPLVVTIPALDLTGDARTDEIIGRVDSVTIGQTGLVTNSILVNRTDAFQMDTGRGVWAAGDTRAVTATNGAFATTLTPLNDGDRLNLLYTDAAGNEFYTQGTAVESEVAQTPVVRAWVGENQVGGLAYYPDEPITITLESNAGGVKSIHVGSAGSGREFGSWSLTDAAGNDAVIEPGDTLYVEFGTADATVTLPVVDPFTLSANADAGVIHGELDGLSIANRVDITGSLIVNVGATDVDWDAAPATEPLLGGTNRAITVAAGVYSTTWAGLTAGDDVWALYTDDQGRQTVRHVAASQSPALGQAWLEVYPHENEVWVDHPQAGAAVTVTLYAGGYPVAEGMGSGSGDVTLYDVYGRPVAVRAGDVVEAAFATDLGVRTYSLVVPAMSALANYEDDTVSGVGPAGQPIEVSVNGPARTVTPDGSGRYSSDFTGFTDVQPGDGGYLFYVITDTAEVRLSVYLEFNAPQVIAYKGQTRFDGFTAFSSWTGATPVTATLYRDGQEVGWTAFLSDGYYEASLCDPYGNCNNDQGNAAAMQPGDELVVTARGEPEVRITLPELTAWAVVNEDVVWGESDRPDTDLGVTINGLVQTVRTDGAGGYEARFDAPPFVTDITRGDEGTVQYLTPEGHLVQLDFRAPFLRAYVGENRAILRVATQFNVTGTLTLVHDTYYVYQAAFNSSGGSDTTVRFYDNYDNPVIIDGGDTLTLEIPDDDPITLDVPDFAVAADPATDQVTVVGPAGIQSTVSPSPTLFLHFHGRDIPLTSATDTYVASFASSDAVLPGEAGTVMYTDGDGDEVYVPFVTPILRVHESSADVEGATVTGYGQANQLVALARERDGAALWSGAEVAAGSGAFTFTLPLAIQPGDVIAAQGGGLDESVVVVPLDAAADVQADAVAGSGPADVDHTGGPTHTLWVNVDSSPIAFDAVANRYASGETQVVTTTGDGAFVADFGTDIGSGDRVEVRYVNRDGHQVYAQFEASAPAPEPQVHIWQGRPDGGVVIWGVAGEPNAVVWVTLYESDGMTRRASWRGSSDGAGNFQVPEAGLQNVYGEMVRVEGGDRVEVETLGWSSGLITVEPLSAVADVASDVVSGSGPANIVNLDGPESLTVGVGTFELAATTDGSGDFSADWGAALGVDIGVGDAGWLRYTDGDGNNIYRQFYAPGLHVWKDADKVWGTVGAPEVTVTVSLMRGPDTVGEWSGPADAVGGFDAELRDGTGAPALVREGDQVVVRSGRSLTAPDEAYTVTVPALSVTADRETEVIGGDGPVDGARVQIWHNGVWRADATVYGGVYAADLVGQADVQAQDTVEARYRTAEGHWLYATAGVPGVGVTLYSGGVNGRVAGSMARVTVTLETGTGAVKASDVVIADREGSFGGLSLLDQYGNPAAVWPGDRLIVEAAGGVTAVYTVPRLTGVLNVDEDRVSGIGPVGEPVEVCAGYCQTVWTDPVSGTYQADFTGRADVLPGASGAVIYADPDGNTYATSFIAPNINVEYQGNPQQGSYVYGNPSGVLTYTVELERGGEVIARLFGQGAAGGGGAGGGWAGAKDVMLVIDRSGSMGGQPLADAKEASKTFVDMLSLPPDQVGLVSFESWATLDQELTTSQVSITQAIDNLAAGGGTNIGAAIDLATQELTGTRHIPSNAQVMILLSDGYGGDPIPAAERAKSAGIRVIVIGLGTGVNESLLQGIATSPSDYYHAPTSADLADIFGLIGGGGRFSFHLTDLMYGNPLLTEEGDRVILREGGGETGWVQVVELGAMVDVFADAVYGSGPNNRDIEVTTEAGNKTIFTTGGGDFVAANPFYLDDEEVYYDFVAGSTGQVIYREYDGDLVFYDYTAPYLEVWAGFEPGLGSTNNRDDGYLEGGGWPMGRPVVLTLYDSAAQVKDTETRLGADFAGWNFFVDGYGNPVEIEPGDRVTAQAVGVPAMEVLVPQVDGLVVDTEADLVQGDLGATAAVLPVHPAGSLTHTLRLYVNGVNGIERPLTTTAAGVFEHVFGYETPPVDVTPGSMGSLRYVDLNGNEARLRFEAPREAWTRPFVELWEYDTAVWGTVLLARVPVTATLYRDGVAQAVASGLSDVNGEFQFDFQDGVYGNDVPILPGDEVLVEAQGASPVTVVAEAMSVAPDPAADRIVGAAPTVGELEVEVNGVWLAVDVIGGAWMADYEAHNVDLVAGDAGEIRYTNPDGNVVHLNFWAPMARAYLYTNKVEGYGIYPNRLVTATLTNGPGNVKPEAIVANRIADGSGWFELAFVDRFGQPVAIWPGDRVTVYPAGAAPHVLDVVPLDSSANPDTDVVAGLAPPSERVRVDLLDAAGNVAGTLSAVADGAGEFSAGFSGLVDILAGTRGRVTYLLSEQGDEEVLDLAAPVIWVREGAGSDAGLVHGLADRMGRVVRVEVSRPGSGLVATGLGEATLDFAVTVRDIYGNVVPVLPGDTVEASFDGGMPIPVDVPAAALGATVNVDEDTVAVTGPANEYVEVDLNVNFPNSSGLMERTVLLDGSGQGSVNYGGYYDLPAGVWGYVHNYDVNGNSVYVNFADPVITVYEHDTYISGYVAATAGLARARLVRESEVIAAGSSQIAADGQLLGEWGWWDWSGRVVLRDEYGLPTVIEPGDRVVVEVDGVDVATIPVEALSVSVDVAGDVVTLVGPDGRDAEVQFTANPGEPLPADRTVATTGAAQVVDYADPVDPTRDVLRPGAAGVVRTHTADGHWIQANFATPLVRVYEERNEVDGNAGAPRAAVTVVLRRGGDVVASAATEADADGGFQVAFVDGAGRPVDVTSDGNETVEVSINGGGPIVVPAVALSAAVDVENDVVSGSAGTGDRPILVTVQRGWQAADLTVPGGAYVADFRGLWDVQAGDEGEIKYINADGHEVYLDWAAPIVRVNLGDDDVDGYVAVPGAEVEVTLLAGSTTLAVEGTEANPANGWFSVRLRDEVGDQVLIEAGQTVEVRADGVLVATVDVPTLTAHADELDDTVAGDAPTGEVQVEVDGVRQTVLAGSPYTADFADLTDIEVGSWGEVQVRDGAGNEVYREFAPPVIRAELRGSHVEGWVGYENVTVTVMVAGGAANVAVQEMWVEDMAWAVELRDVYGAAYYLQPGDVVSVTTSGGPGSGAVQVVEVEAVVDVDVDTVSGTAPTSGLVQVTLDPPEGASLTAQAGGGGYTADFRGLADLTAGTVVEAARIDADGDYIYLHTSAPHVRVKVYDNLVWGYARHDVPVALALRRGTAVVAEAYGIADGTGYYTARFRDEYDEPLQIRPGDRVEVTVEGQTTTVDVVDLGAVPDVAADTVGGAAPSGGQVNVVLFGTGCQKTLTASGGSYLASNPFYTEDRAVCDGQDMAPGTDGEVRYINADGNWVYRSFVAPILEVQMAGSQTGAEVWGFTNAPGELVTVTILHDGDIHTGYGRSRLADSFFQVDLDLPLEAGDGVTARWASASRSLTLPDWSATVNPDTGDVGGRAPAGRRVEVIGYGVGYAAGDGTYAIPAGVWEAGAQRDVMFTDPSTLDRVWIRAVAPIVYVHEGHDVVWGYARFADAAVGLTVMPGDPFRLPWSVNTTSDPGNGYFYARMGGPLLADDDVQVTVGGRMTVITVIDLSATADAAAETVSGTGPAGAELDVWTPEGQRTVVAEADGAFTARFADERLPGDRIWPINIRPGDVGTVEYTNEDGNVIYTRFNAPLLRAHLTNQTVKGYAPPKSSVLVTLRDGGGALKATAQGSSDEDGLYFVTFDGPDILAGDFISVAVRGAPQLAMTVESLTGTLDTENDRVIGSGPPNGRVSVAVYQADKRQNDGEGGSEEAWRLMWDDRVGWTTPLRRIRPTESGGAFEADFRGKADLASGNYVYVQTGDYNAETQTALVLNGPASALVSGLWSSMPSYGVEEGLILVKHREVRTIDEGEVISFTYVLTHETGLVFGVNWTNQFRRVDDEGFWWYDSSWGGTVDQLELWVYRPDGKLHNVAKGSGSLAPIYVPALPQASVGAWRFEVRGVKVPYDNMQIALTVAEVTPPTVEIYLPLVMRE